MKNLAILFFLGYTVLDGLWSPLIASFIIFQVSASLLHFYIFPSVHSIQLPILRYSSPSSFFWFPVQYSLQLSISMLYLIFHSSLLLIGIYLSVAAWFCLLIQAQCFRFSIGVDGMIKFSNIIPNICILQYFLFGSLIFFYIFCQLWLFQFFFYGSSCNYLDDSFYSCAFIYNCLFGISLTRKKRRLAITMPEGLSAPLKRLDEEE